MLPIFLVSLNSVLIIITIIAIGTFLGKIKLFSDSFSSNISELVVDVALPVSIFASTQKYITHSNFKILAFGTLLIMIAILICFGIAFIIGRAFNISQLKKGIFINGFVNSNTLFVGLPLNIALFGNSSLPYFLAYFIANTIATWGIGVNLINKDATQNKDHQKSNTQKLSKLLHLLTPPMWGFIIGIIFFTFNIPLPNFITSSFNYLANLVTPLSLIFLGLQVANTRLSSFKIQFLDIISQIGKFLVSPFIMLSVIYVYTQFFYLPKLFIDTAVIQAATPMLTLLPMLAEKANVDVTFATRILTQSIFIFPFIIIAIRVLLN